MTSAHIFHVRVYYEDTDSGGVVYYANYLKFAERARTEMLRALGFEQTDLWDKHDIGFVVRKCEVDFLKPARFNDHLTIETQLLDIGKVKCIMHQRILCGDHLLVTLTVTLATVSKAFKVAPLPACVRDTLCHTLTPE